MEIKENVRVLQQMQLHEGKVKDTILINNYACHAAYPDDAIVQRLLFSSPDIPLEHDFERIDILPPSRTTTMYRIDNGGSQPMDLESDEEQEEQQHGEEEEGEEDESEEDESEEDESEEDNDGGEHALLQPPAKKTKNDLPEKCSGQCKKCTRCVCKRAKRKCHDACGCGDSCQNK